MNQYLQNIQTGSISAARLVDWSLSHGVSSLTTQDVAHLCGVPSNQVSQRLAPLRQRGMLISPARGFWVPVPVEYRTWGAPDPMFYIDDMMEYVGAEYCVGWLSSAAVHGASHHAAQVFQVAANKTVRDRNVGRSRLEFYNRSFAGSLSLSKVTAGRSRAKVASAGTTMLMLASDAGCCGGIDNVANLVIELAEESRDFERDLLVDAHLFPDSASRRVGWLLDRFGEGAPESLVEYCRTLKSERSFLTTSSMRVGRLDARWRIVENGEVDPDI